MLTLDDITTEYFNKRPNIVSILGFINKSRVFGFPVVNALGDKSEEEQLVWARRLLLNAAEVEIDRAYGDDELFALLKDDDTQLYHDAHMLITVATKNT